MFWKLYYKNTLVVEDDNLKRVLDGIEHLQNDKDDALADFNLVPIVDSQ